MALQYVEAQRQARPDLAEWYASLEDLYQRKLWHQLTLKLDQFLQLQAAQTGDTIIQLYNNFITDFETKINLLKLAHFAVIASRQYPDKDAAITFLEGVITKLRETRESRINEPILYVKMQIAAINLEKGNQKECKNLLEEGKTTLDSMTDVDPTVHASFYWISSQYHKARQEFAEFYKKALLYLAYTTVESLSELVKLDLAFDLSLAALLGDNIYNFGELLAHPIINSLIGTKGEWVYRMLQAFNTGNLALYQELCRVHSAALLCLMEIIFSRPSEDRTIPLSVIAERTKLSVSDVENLLMKSLSVHLIEGIVDEVDSTVHVSSVQPRVLGIPKVKGSREIQKPIQLRPDKNIQACPQTLDRTDSHPRNIFSFAIHPPPPPPMDSKRRNPPRAAAPRPASAAAPRKRTTGRLPPPGPSPRCPADSAIQKPASDHRSYSHVVLTNNLDCILVSDPRSEKVAVSINVPTGYFCDPDDLEGLSQAVQSSLLCGNSAFVGFLHFLSENKGSIRAITFGERTSYCVDGSIASFQELLTRFARFFKDPSKGVPSAVGFPHRAGSGEGL